MGTLLDYIGDCGRRRFDELPFTPVDNLVLAQAAYLELDNPRRLSLRALLTGRTVIDKHAEFAAALSAARRYDDVIPLHYVANTVEESTKQFAATAFMLPDSTIYVAYRGTDGTLVGWKEDFNLAFDTPVSAQLDAVEYLRHIADIYPAMLRVGGHSKGGNLAVYAAANVPPDVQRRILDVYTNDGPGMNADIIATAGYNAIKDRIRLFIPQSSIIGMLLEQTDLYRVVRSDAQGLMQHSAYTWRIDGADFDYAAERTNVSVRLDDVVYRWINNMTIDERREFTDALFEILSIGGVTTVNGLLHNWTNLPARVEDFRRVAPDSWPVMSMVVTRFVQAAAQQYQFDISAGLAGFISRLDVPLINEMTRDISADNVNDVINWFKRFIKERLNK